MGELGTPALVVSGDGEVARAKKIRIVRALVSMRFKYRTTSRSNAAYGQCCIASHSVCSQLLLRRL